jgi:hypothetical protein
VSVPIATRVAATPIDAIEASPQYLQLQPRQPERALM